MTRALNRRMLLKSGLLVSGAVVMGTASPFLTGVAQASSGAIQAGWSWCDYCQAIYYGPNQSKSRCPLNGTHDGYQTASLPYLISYGGADAGQPNWRWCGKCQGLFYQPEEANSCCPAGGTHTAGSSSNYEVLFRPATNPANFQRGWDECSKCQGLFYTQDTQNPNVCPRDFNPHTGTSSGSYFVQVQ
jgi:hypothetical protein